MPRLSRAPQRLHTLSQEGRLQGQGLDQLKVGEDNPDPEKEEEARPTRQVEGQRRGGKGVVKTDGFVQKGRGANIERSPPGPDLV